MKDIAIFGGGGFGREVYRLIETINLRKKEWNIIGFFDDNISVDFGQSSVPLNYLGGVKELNNFPAELALVIAIGDPRLLKKVFENIKNTYVTFPNIIAPDAWISDLKLGIGNIITFNCIFTDNVVVGNFNVFNLKVSVGHDVRIGDFNVFNPNTVISGHVQIGGENFFGLNSSVVQNKKIGTGNKIGAGTLIIKNIKDNGSYFGLPGYKTEFN